MQLLQLPLSAIRVEDRLREVDHDRATEMATSMRESGQITPIEVAPEGADGRYKLIAGAHRVAAARIAGLASIWARVFDGSADEARLREIDENLYRRELGPLDQAAFIAERRAIYERVFGEVKPGRKRRGELGASLRQLNFFDDVTEKFGLSRHTIKRALWRNHAICNGAWNQLKGSRFAEKGAVLDAIGRLAPEMQVRVVEQLVGGQSKSVGDALTALGASKRVDEDARQLQALIGGWSKAGVPARGQFIAYLVKSHAPSLRKALKDGAAA